MLVTQNIQIEKLFLKDNSQITRQSFLIIHFYQLHTAAPSVLFLNSET